MNASATERAIRFDCEGDALPGILHAPGGEARGGVGMIIVVGGPQYRIGSHRQFVHLGRAVAAAGFPVLRFDYRGLGDAEGAPRDFLSVDKDIAAACAALRAERPDVTRIAGWGLCDAASALARFVRTAGPMDALILANPWVHCGAGSISLAAYYRARLTSSAFWRSLVRGEVGLPGIPKAEPRHRAPDASGGDDPSRADPAPPAMLPGADGAYVDEMRRGLEGFPGPIYLLSSGRDLTADEFRDRLRRDRRWRRVRKDGIVEEHRLTAADHTFSSLEAKEDVAQQTARWLTQIGSGNP